MFKWLMPGNRLTTSDTAGLEVDDGLDPQGFFQDDAAFVAPLGIGDDIFRPDAEQDLSGSDRPAGTGRCISL